jgi:mannose-6-phosphate isomerase
VNAPVVLPPNLVPRFYRGGEAIAALRGVEPGDERTPEEWVGSATTAWREQTLGLSALPDGTLVRDALRADPEALLGPQHAERLGPDPALLVKILDAGERLPVHVHPDDAFARAELGTRYGKTEAWIILSTSRADAAVHLGLREPVDAATLAGWVCDQDHDALLDSLERLPVAAGDAVFVPAGTPHAIGEGILMVELQQPTDLSVLLEWEGFGIDDEDEATLGLGWGRALGCVDLEPRDAEALRGPRAEGEIASLLPAAADGFFRAQRVAPTDGAPLELEVGFAVVVVVEGEGRLGELPVRRGDTLLVPHAAGAVPIQGAGVVALACRPPEADA